MSSAIVKSKRTTASPTKPKRTRKANRNQLQTRAEWIREMGKMDYRSAMSDSFEEGFEEGRLQVREEIARTMKQKGYSVADISRSIDLPVSQIAELCGEKTIAKSLIAPK